MTTKLLKFLHREKGQSLVEFALVMTVVIVMLMLPVDFYFYIRNNMILNNAASESLSELKEGDISSDTVQSILKRNYSDKLDLSKITVEMATTSSKDDYSYYVYNSELANSNESDFSKQFDKRPADYKKEMVTLKLQYTSGPVTLLGKQLLGTSYTINSRRYSRDIKVD